MDDLFVVQVKKDFQEAVLSYRQDEFFHKNMYANFGDIGSAVKELVDEFQKQTTNTKRINTIEDMQVSSQSSAPCECFDLASLGQMHPLDSEHWFSQSTKSGFAWAA